VKTEEKETLVVIRIHNHGSQNPHILSQSPAQGGFIH
jgi:hypothetical protein